MGVPEPARSRESPPPQCQGGRILRGARRRGAELPQQHPWHRRALAAPSSAPTGGREGWGCPHPIPGEPTEGSLMVPAQLKRRRLVWLLSEGCESTGRAARLSLNRQNEDKGTE